MNLQRLFICFVAAVLATTALLAQGTVTIFGTVSDTSGAVLADASITITNTQTGAVRRTTTDSSGKYFAAQLPIGVYEVRAEASGFKTFIQREIPVQVDENRRVDAVMEIGALSESITVSGELAQVETREGVIKEVVDAKRIVELPLNGRNALQLQYLVAGIGGRTAPGQAQNESVPVNGLRSNGNNYTLDGGDNHDPFFNTPSVFPSPDALEEFSIQTSVYGADKGRNPGATMTAVTKSGTNRLHGTLFEFLRNDKLNARNFFSIGVPPFRRNQYGGTVGGPVRKDRVFFFFSYQGTRERSSPSATTATVLTAAQRTGDFSALSKRLTDPSGGAFAGNIIPASRLYTPSLKFLDKFVPMPNLGSSLLTFASPQYLNDGQYVSKIDARLSSANQISGRLLRSFNDTGQTPGNIPGFLAAIKYWNWNVAINDTHIFSPTAINTFTFSYQKIDRRQLSVVPGNITWTDLGAGVVRSFTEDLPAGHDTIVDGYFEAFSRFPLNQFRTVYEFSDMMSLSRGPHLIKFGGRASFGKLDRIETFRGDAYVRFRNTFTGDAGADFMIGRPTQILQQSLSILELRGSEWAAFLQDDWRVSSRLSLNLGMRWEPFLPYTELKDRVSRISVGQQSVVFPTAPRGLIYPGDAGMPRAGIENSWTGFAPRFGFAWDPTGKARFSVRGGWGLYYGNYRLQGYSRQGPAYRLDLTLNNPPGGLANPYSEGGNPWPYKPPTTPEQRATFKFNLPATTSFQDPDFRSPIVQQWNLSLQRQFQRDWLATIAYVGSKGDHLYMQSEFNPGIFGAPGATLDQRRRLYPLFGTLSVVQSVGNSIYHALQATLNKRLSHGFTVLANYTWGKSIDNSSDDGDNMPNPFNYRSNRGPSGFDIGHRFVSSLIWDLPQPKGGNAVARRLLGGWEINGIVTLETGQGFTVVSGRDNSGSGVNADRADLVGDPSLPGDRSKGEKIKRYFNTAAFAPNLVGTFGNVGRNSLRRPGNATTDFGLIKNTVLNEKSRLQFRAEAFNMLNRANLAGPNANQSAATFGTITNAYDPRVVQLALKFMF